MKYNKCNCTPNCVECSPNKLKTGDKIFLECLGNIEGNRWLNGISRWYSYLAPDTSGEYTGTQWEVFVCNGKLFLNA